MDFCHGLVYIDLVFTYAEKHFETMGSGVEWYERVFKELRRHTNEAQFEKIFQKVMIYTKVSIKMFFSTPKLVLRPLYLFSILSWILIHYCLADLPLLFLLRIATVRINLLKERASDNL